MLVLTIKHPLTFGIGLLGNIISFLVILSPLPTFIRVFKKKSTESFQSIPYVLALFSALLWLYYGLLTWDAMLLSINAVSCVVESIYLLIYLSYAPKKTMAFTLKLIFLFNVGIFGYLVLVSLLFMKGRRRTATAGWICAAFAVSVFVAPLGVIKLVIRTKSVEYMPFSLSFFLTLNAIVWLIYGLLIRDPFVALPNVVGLLFGIAQMIIYFTFMNAKDEQKKPKVADEDVNAMPATPAKSDIEMVDNKNISEKLTGEIEPSKPEAGKPEA